MPKEIPGTNGFRSYGGKSEAPPAQKEFPKAQGGAAPVTTKEIPGTGGFVVRGRTPATAAPSDQGDGTWGTFFYDMAHPKPADLSRPQTWRDWGTRTYDPTAKQIGTAALDDVTFGYADPIQSHFTGENVADIRARTADAQAALGPGAPIVNAATYAIPGMGVARGLKAAKAAGKVTGALGRYGAAGLEGSTASGLSSVGHHAFDPEHPQNYYNLGGDIILGGALGVGGQAAGDTVAALARPVIDKVMKRPGRSSETQWDWRTRAKKDPEGVRAEVDDYRNVLPANAPAQKALERTSDALGYSVTPGAGFDIASTAAEVTAAKLGLDAGVSLGESFIPGGVVGGGVRWMGDRTARGINRIDKNIQTGQAFDKLYPALYGPKSTTDTSGWADALRRTTIGSERPGPPGSQFW